MKCNISCEISIINVYNCLLNKCMILHVHKITSLLKSFVYPLILNIRFNHFVLAPSNEEDGHHAHIHGKNLLKIFKNLRNLETWNRTFGTQTLQELLL